MSDRRTHAERVEGIVRAVRLLDLEERKVYGVRSIPDTDVVERVFRLCGFGDAWRVSWGASAFDGIVVTLTVENTDAPEFVLVRLRSNRPEGPEHVWTTYMPPSVVGSMATGQSTRADDPGSVWVRFPEGAWRAATAL